MVPSVRGRTQERCQRCRAVRCTPPVWRSLCSALAVGIVCVVGLVSLRNVSSVTRSAVTRQIATLDESRVFESLLYQKGFLAQYMLTADLRWVAQIDVYRQGFEQWLASASN